MNKQTSIILLTALLVFPFVNADIIIPTISKVYFEQNKQPYNGKIDFKVNGYGYNTGIPPNFVEKKAGTYTPEVVFSFSASYKNYGDQIDEDFYMNYRHIDYFELEGTTYDGRKFVIKNISNLLGECNDVDDVNLEKYNACISKLDKPSFIDPSKQPVGTVRMDYLGRNWTKKSDGYWYSLSVPGTAWGDSIWQESDKDMYKYNEDKKVCSDISPSTYGRKCNIRFNLDNANWDYTSEPVKKGFWESISCFFKKLFGKNC